MMLQIVASPLRTPWRS